MKIKTLGQKIKYLRENQKLTQPKLAKIIKVSNGMISFWENDKNEPKASNIIELAKIFDVSTDYLLGLEDETGCKINDNEQEYKEEFDYFDGTHKIHHTKK